MLVIRKIILIAGCLAALAAAEGLNRFGGFVSALGGGDAPFYMTMLVISVVSAGVLILGFFNKSNTIVKWVMFVLSVGSAGMMLNAPSFPVNVQIVIGLVISAVAMVFIKIESKQG